MKQSILFPSTRTALAALFALLLVFGLFACGKGGGSGGSNAIGLPNVAFTPVTGPGDGSTTPVAGDIYFKLDTANSTATEIVLDLIFFDDGGNFFDDLYSYAFWLQMDPDILQAPLGIEGAELDDALCQDSCTVFAVSTTVDGIFVVSHTRTNGGGPGIATLDDGENVLMTIRIRGFSSGTSPMTFTAGKNEAQDSVLPTANVYGATWYAGSITVS